MRATFSPRRFRRYQRVVRILAHHGFGYLITQLGWGHLIPRRLGLVPVAPDGRPYTPAEHLRIAFEELGATFIKLGQILSTRPDLLPSEYIAELARLQDAVPPEPFPLIQGQVEKELGKSMADLFAGFEEQPLGSASLGQVHAARLLTGEEVVVKVQRPGVEKTVEEDIHILMDAARLASTQTTWGQIYDLPALVQEFANTIREELDYYREGRNAERIASNFAGDPALLVPRINWALTTRRVLTMERIHGIKINNLAALDQAGIDRQALARVGAGIIVKMVLEDGYFHADPHPGNFLVSPGPVIGLLDYGMVGELGDETRHTLLLLFLAVLDRDMERVVDRLSDLGVAGSQVQMGRLKGDLERLTSHYFGRPLREIDVSRVLDESLEAARRHRLHVPTRLALLGKTISMHEGLARQLDPEFNLAEVLGPRARRLAFRAYSPARWAKRLLPTLIDLGNTAVTLPRRLERLLAQAERGQLSVNMRVSEAEHYLDDINRMVNRLIVGMLTASFIVGLAFLLGVTQPRPITQLFGWLIGAGFIASSVLGLWLLLAIWRSGHH